MFSLFAPSAKEVIHLHLACIVNSAGQSQHMKLFKADFKYIQLDLRCIRGSFVT